MKLRDAKRNDAGSREEGRTEEDRAVNSNGKKQAIRARSGGRGGVEYDRFWLGRVAVCELRFEFEFGQRKATGVSFVLFLLLLLSMYSTETKDARGEYKAKQNESQRGRARKS